MRLNKTTKFLLPALKLDSIKYWQSLRDNGLDCVFLQDENIDYNNKTSLFIRLEYSDLYEAHKLYKIMKTHPNFINHYINEDFTGMYIFKFPEKYSEVIDLFKEGKYSLFPEEYKKTYFPKFINGIISNRWQILYKHELLRKQIETELEVTLDADVELHDIPNMDAEIFKKI